MGGKVFKQDIVAESVRDWILSGKYSPGEKLPNVRELSVQFGMNVRTILAGINQLVREGLVTSAPHRGIVVCRPAVPVSNTVPFLAVSEGDMYGSVAHFSDRRLAEDGLFLIAADSNILKDKEEIRSFLSRILAGQRPYGFLVEGSTNIPYEDFAEHPDIYSNMVFVFTYNYPSRLPFCRYVLTDYAEMGRAAADYFAAHGKKNIIFPASRELYYEGPWSSIQVAIMQGLASRAKELDLRFDEQMFWDLLHGRITLGEAIGKAFRKRAKPDAVFSWADGRLKNVILPELKKVGGENILKVGAINSRFAEECGFASFDMLPEKTLSAAIDMLTGKEKRREIVFKPVLVEHGKPQSDI